MSVRKYIARNTPDHHLRLLFSSSPTTLSELLFLLQVYSPPFVIDRHLRPWFSPLPTALSELLILLPGDSLNRISFKKMVDS
ncbi:unnamed protein product [Allacma fusca]|uniref:Uncharacterized protein n=1 Tax=Allacma fusca TaxID=39272 RepID=A0A8J2J038_9HEXA|nr:unnamed protein product [Allacma fusca]